MRQTRCSSFRPLSRWPSRRGGSPLKGLPKPWSWPGQAGIFLEAEAMNGSGPYRRNRGPDGDPERLLPPWLQPLPIQLQARQADKPAGPNAAIEAAKAGTPPGLCRCCRRGAHSGRTVKQGGAEAQLVQKIAENTRAVEASNSRSEVDRGVTVVTAPVPGGHSSATEEKTLAA